MKPLLGLTLTLIRPRGRNHAQFRNRAIFVFVISFDSISHSGEHSDGGAASEFISRMGKIHRSAS